MIRTVSALMMILMLLVVTPVFAADEAKPAASTPKQEEMLKKIQLLEQQINELRELKLKKQSLPVKMDQCMKVVGVEPYCDCVVQKLPVTVDYKQFVQIMLGTSAELGYDKMTPEQKKDVDLTTVAWAKCVTYKGPAKPGIIENIMNRDTLLNL